jgi:hypothetical protein
VSSIGVLTGIRLGRATITATSSDGPEVTVADVTTGLPARVRFAHAADDRAPVTFTPSQGAPVTLAFGESVELPVVSGTFGAHIHGQEFLGVTHFLSGQVDTAIDRQWLIRGGEHLEVYATRFGMAEAFSVPGSSGVRFVQGATNRTAQVVLLGPPGVEAGRATLIECYFDPNLVTVYTEVPAGEFDVIAGGKGLFETRSGGVTRRVMAPPGRAVTYVIVGDSLDTVRLLSFPAF